MSTPPTITYYGGGTAGLSESIFAGFDGGYFITNTAAVGGFSLRSVTAPDTEVSSYPIQTVGLNVAHNTAGQVYAIGSATSTTCYLSSVAVSGTAFTVGTAGTFTHTPSNTRFRALSYDGTEFLVFDQTNTKFLVLSTVNASVVTTTTNASFASVWPVAAAGSGRIVATDSATGEFELWDTAQLDTLAFSHTVNGTNPKPVIPIGTDRLFFCMGIDSTNPIQLWIGVLSTAGNVLSYEWESTITTQWSSTNSLVMLADVKDGFATIVPRRQFVDDPSYLYTVDVNAGDYLESASDTNVAPGANLNTQTYAGRNYFVWTEANAPNQIRVWSLTYAATGSTYLRRRQSPAYTPSRVRPPQLRQRQRPEVT